MYRSHLKQVKKYLLTHDIIGWSFNKLTFHEVLSLVLKRSLQLMEQDLKMGSVAESWMDNVREN